MKSAPIVLFVYNRPGHTRGVIESLKLNPLSSESDLIIYSDAPRIAKDIPLVDSVRKIISSVEGFRSVTIHNHNENHGLAASIINGVDTVINYYHKAIILEDDLVLSPYFLEYMNHCLELYASDSRIFSIGAYTPRLRIPWSYPHNYFLSYRCCTWGWGTWIDRWQKVNWDVPDYDRFINNPHDVSLFNRGGDDMSELFRLQMSGKINSWAIRWDYAHFRNNGHCFRPTYSLVRNTGNDGSGVHCGTTDKFDVTVNCSSLPSLPSPLSLTLNSKINQRFAYFYDGRPKSWLGKNKHFLLRSMRRLQLAIKGFARPLISHAFRFRI